MPSQSGRSRRIDNLTTTAEPTNKLLLFLSKERWHRFETPRIVFETRSTRKLGNIIHFLFTIYISLEIWIRITKAFIWTVALYGCGTCTIGKQERRLLEALEVWRYRMMMMKVSWRDQSYQRRSDERSTGSQISLEAHPNKKRQTRWTH